EVKTRRLMFKILGAAGLAVLAIGFAGLSNNDQWVWLILFGGAVAAWSTRLRDRLPQSKPSLELPLSSRDQIQLDNWVMAKGGIAAAQFVGYKCGMATYENVPQRISEVLIGISEGRFSPPSNP
ncbi:hypothetical protein, partial [Nevskia ramosa]|uniref:hypothetical protein n=1 Tax=Nevskia ramosa TaxID=64002 RepID=UPI002353EFA1